MKRSSIAGLLLAVLLSSVIFVNCSDDDSPTAPSDENRDIMPLAAGNIWNYADTVTGMQNAVFTSRWTVTGDTTVTVELLDYDVFTLEFYDTFNQAPATYYVQTNDFAYWEFGTRCGQDELLYVQMNAKYPAEVGEKWVKGFYLCDPNQYITGMLPDTTVCISVDSLVTVPAGSFRCHVYYEHHVVQMMGMELDIYAYYSPGVGMVMREYIANLGVYWKSSLVDYDLN